MKVIPCQDYLMLINPLDLGFSILSPYFSHSTYAYAPIYVYMYDMYVYVWHVCICMTCMYMYDICIFYIYIYIYIYILYIYILYYIYIIYILYYIYYIYICTLYIYTYYIYLMLCINIYIHIMLCMCMYNIYIYIFMYAVCVYCTYIYNVWYLWHSPKNHHPTAPHRSPSSRPSAFAPLRRPSPLRGRGSRAPPALRVTFRGSSAIFHDGDRINGIYHRDMSSMGYIMGLYGI